MCIFLTTITHFISFITMVEIQDGIKSKIWCRALDFDAFAKQWATQFACLITKPILKFGCCCRIILHIAIMLPNFDSFLELSTMLSTTSLQSSSICTFDRLKLPSHKITFLKPNASAYDGDGKPSYHLDYAFMK